MFTGAASIVSGKYTCTASMRKPTSFVYQNHDCSVCLVQTNVAIAMCGKLAINYAHNLTAKRWGDVKMINPKLCGYTAEALAQYRVSEHYVTTIY